MKNDGLIINEIKNESIIRKGLKNKLVTAEFSLLETKHFAVFNTVLLVALTVDKTGILPKCD